MQVNKSNAARLRLCVKCEHEAVAQDAWPCNCCWNPLGDMYREKTQPLEPKKPRIFLSCTHCNGMGEIEVANV